MIDWSKAPDWARYHAFDKDEQGTWYANAPFCNNEIGVYIPSGECKRSNLSLPEGVSWHESLTARHQSKAAPIETKTMLLITVNDVLVTGNKKTTTTEHVLTELSLSEFIIAYSKHVQENCNLYLVNVFFTIQNTVEIEITAQEIEQMQSERFPLRFFP